MICFLCGKSFDADEEPVIITKIDLTRKLHSGNRVEETRSDLRAHRQCWQAVEINIQLAENEIGNELEQERKERR